MVLTDERYLLPTDIINSDHPDIIRYAQDNIGHGNDTDASLAVKLYLAVRDNIWYTPYYPFYLPEHYKASNVLKSGKGYCVSKASLLCALGRACQIPSRVGFADVKNHLATKQLIDYLGSDLFVYHGYVEFYLSGKWVKATPAFNAELCERHQVAPLDFNGREDSIFHAYNREKRQFMEYMVDHGVYADIPVDEIIAAWEKAYGKKRVAAWIEQFEAQGQSGGRNFYREEVII